MNGEACGTELAWHTGTGDYIDLQWATTFDAATEVSSVYYTILGPDGVAVTWFPDPVDGGLSTVERELYLSHGNVYTLVVRVREGDVWSTDPVASCRFGVRQPPVVALTVPVLGAGAVYVYGEARGGAGVAGQYLVAATRQGEAVAYEYAVTANSSRPATWESIAVADSSPALIPVVPTASGSQYLHVRGVDRYGVRGPARWKNFLVGTVSTTKPAPPAITVRGLEDSISGDGRLPLEVTLTSDLEVRPMGEVVLRHGTQEVGRTTFDAQSETVLVEQAPLGTGFQDIAAEYRQFEGAPTLSATARICADGCPFAGGKATITAYDDVRLDPNLYVEVSGFSPQPTSYKFEWLRAGKVVSSGRSDEDAHYLSLPPDEGHTLTARVTAYGPGMAPKTVTASVKIGDREDADVCYGGKTIGSRWLTRYTYCSPQTVSFGVEGSGRAIEMLVAEPWLAPGYTSSRAGELPDDGSPTPAYWFDLEGYVQGQGWQGLKVKDTIYYVGSVGQNRRLEAFRIDDGGVLAPYYDVWYRAYVPKYGWLGWAKNGGNAGTVGFANRIESIQIKVLPKGKQLTSGSGNAAYYSAATQRQVHVRSYLQTSNVWRTPVVGGSTAGLTSTSQRLSAVRVDVDGTRYSGGVQVAAKVEGDGWRGYVSNDRVAGTYHSAHRVSAYKMRLTGQMAEHYHVYYRAHVAGIGWLGWARNGGEAGSASYTKRVTAVQVLLVPKGDPAPQSGRVAYLR
ncbi:hypothetical protein [Promicromonospora soli]|uniref:Hydrophobic W protein n=1 Tax=Promicromonospora soli TaxID=2035533 RepID=A0A919FSG1_9MICO|nr:hypothetical protein [Promicromonospora soli]GHH71099.1 hypothetical protein GCM10017772_18860 [Promicromonospora soli]